MFSILPLLTIARNILWWDTTYHKDYTCHLTNVHTRYRFHTLHRPLDLWTYLTTWLDLDRTVHYDLCGSDQFPILLKQVSPIHTDHTPTGTATEPTGLCLYSYVYPISTIILSTTITHHLFQLQTHIYCLNLLTTLLNLELMTNVN